MCYHFVSQWNIQNRNNFYYYYKEKWNFTAMVVYRFACADAYKHAHTRTHFCHVNELNQNRASVCSVSKLNEYCVGFSFWAINIANPTFAQIYLRNKTVERISH